MTSLMPRSSLLPDVLHWLESEFPFGDRHVVRIEDYTADGKYVLRAELPGLDPERDIKITVEGDQLTIEAQRIEEKKSKSHSEFRYGAFSRRVHLPAGCDPAAVEARYVSGILEIAVPIRETTEARQVPIATGTTQ
ncbi:Hsp20/alpha crystallin family protein [Amycolatopsis anabasis]|uniref:Hsp20/alpha crystallin family protein n=1 Tax=Amycolatopsis anabasis TaxID=1840409 RepID=UPI00131CC96A|nr:Hsp20/alpha crystallin family protein [Amycolatopsis anabasis]